MSVKVIEPFSTKDKNLKHEYWLRNRIGSIGGSEVAGILGLTPYPNCTPLAIYNRKRAELADPEQSIAAEKERMNDAMMWGHYIEPAVAQCWEDTTKRTIIKSSSNENIYKNTLYPHCHYSPDRTFWLEKVNG